MADLKQIVEDVAVQLLRIAATKLPSEVRKALETSLEKTDGSLGKAQLQAILENVEIADTKSKPMCQDTGLVAFFVRLGDEFPLRSEIKEILIEATKKATKEVPLRPNAVDMFEGNTKTNVGLRGYVPWFYIDLVPGDKLEIIAMPKGGGSSNVGKLKMLPPGKGLKGVAEFVIEAVSQAGSLGCPPYTVGVGIGGGEDMCMNLAKKALLRPLYQYHSDERIAQLEKKLLIELNKLGIGPQGLGGNTTALAVTILTKPCHIASMPVAVNIQCHAARHKSIVL